ncbi:MAG: glucose-6-phosphate dehydrogenase, partial [Chloroflexi bacterium]|nr:glucose-6-phosphate dehydrogenase [Chloroflexota bacterium]
MLTPDPCDDPLAHEPDPFTLILFGATGDLARRKLLPAFFSLAAQGLLSKPFAVVAFARREGSDETFREAARAAIKEFAPGLPTEGPVWDSFAANLYYHRSELGDPAGYERLDARLNELDAQKGLGGNRLFYLAVPPDHFKEVVAHLQNGRLIHPFHTEAGSPWTRV